MRTATRSSARSPTGPLPRRVSQTPAWRTGGRRTVGRGSSSRMPAAPGGTRRPGRSLAAASEGDTAGLSTVQLWDTAGGQLKATLPAGKVLTLAFSPDGKTLATARYGSNWGYVDTVLLWDTASGQLKATLEPRLA